MRSRVTKRKAVKTGFLVLVLDRRCKDMGCAAVGEQMKSKKHVT